MEDTDHTQHGLEQQQQHALRHMPVAVPPGHTDSSTDVRHAVPTLSQSTTVSASHLLLSLQLSAASFAVPHSSYQSQLSLVHDQASQPPSLPPLPPLPPPPSIASPSHESHPTEPKVDPVVIATTPASILNHDLPPAPEPTVPSEFLTPAPTPAPPSAVIQPPQPQPPPTNNDPPALNIPYPLAIHIAILSTLCPTLAHPAPSPPTTVTFSPDLTVTPPPPPTPPPPHAAPASSLDLIPSVFASLADLPLAHTPALVVVDACSPTWDLNKLVHDPDVGVFASCVDLASLGVLEPAKSQQQQSPQADSEGREAVIGPGWHVVPESVGEYWAYLIKSVKDVGVMAQLKQYFGEYLDRRDKLATAQAKHQELLAALEPETTEQQAKVALKDHIHNLHVYNEYQDLAQCIMGQLADMGGVTVRQVYEELGIEVDEGRKKSSRSV